MQRFQQVLAALFLSVLHIFFFGCITPGKVQEASSPSSTALEPTLEPAEDGDEAPSVIHSTVGPYELVTPEEVELLDSGSIKVKFEADCATLGSDRVVVWSDPQDERLAYVGILFAKSECKKGGPKGFERVISPGMTEFGTGLPDQAKVRPMKSAEFRLAPVTSVVIDAVKGVSMTYTAPCEQVVGSQVLSSLEPRSKTLSVAIVYPLSGCKAGPSKTFSGRFDTESDEYLILGGGEKDLLPRPMWIQ